MNENFLRIIKTLEDRRERIVLDIGCGKVKRGNIGIDYIPGPNVDLVMDINQGILLPTESVDEIKMFHVLEHTNDALYVLKECNRILKRGGIIEIRVPHHSNPSAYQIHHKSYWNLFSLDPILNEGDKSNESIRLFGLISKDLKLIRFNFLKKIILKYPYLYESFFCNFFACYEVVYILEKL